MTDVKIGQPMDDAAYEQFLLKRNAKTIQKGRVVIDYDILFHLHPLTETAMAYEIYFGHYFRRDDFVVHSMAVEMGKVKGQDVILLIFDDEHPQIKEHSVTIKPYRLEKGLFNSPKKIGSRTLVSTFVKSLQEISQEKIRIPRKMGETLSIKCNLKPYDNKQKTLIATVFQIDTKK